MSIGSIVFRVMCTRNDNRRDAGLTTPEDIRRFDDIRYGPDRRENVLDVYRPKAAQGALPVIVSVHGGGWVYGDKERYQYYCMSLAQHGFAVVNFSYRLAPRHKFPAALEDTSQAFAWVLEHAENYGFDTEHVFGVGDSAGAHLLGLFACLCTDPAYAEELGIRPPEGFVPTALALNCGVYHVEKDSVSGTLADFLPEKGSEKELRQISVLERANPAFPPSLIMTCEGDFLAEAAPPMAERLRSLGVPVDSRYYGDKEHVLGHVFHCNLRLDEAQRCNREECAYFRSFLPRTDEEG